MPNEVIPSMRVPKGTAARAKPFFKNTTRCQTDILRDALLTGLRVFELDGFSSPQIPESPATAEKKPAKRG